MSEINPLYKEIWTCKECGKEFRNKFKDYELCFDCIQPILKEIDEKVKIKMLYKTKINYDKYDTGKNRKK